MIYIVQANLFSNNSFKNYRDVVNMFKKVQWDKFQAEQKQRCYNQATIAYNMLGVHDSAHIIARQAIEILPSAAYPYATLGETFAFQNQMDSCFFYIEKSLKGGMPVRLLDKDKPPYDQLWDMVAFQDILKKYQPTEEETSE